MTGCRKGLLEVADGAAGKPANGLVLESMSGDSSGGSNAAGAAAEAGAKRRSLGADVLLCSWEPCLMRNAPPAFWSTSQPAAVGKTASLRIQWQSNERWLGCEVH